MKIDKRFILYVGLFMVSGIADAALIFIGMYLFVVPATFSVIMSGALIALRLSRRRSFDGLPLEE